MTFRSALVPPYVRKAHSLEAALPWLYLKGISTGEMHSALSVLMDADAQGFSSSTVALLKARWGEEYQAWCGRGLDQDQWVYLWTVKYIIFCFFEANFSFPAQNTRHLETLFPSFATLQTARPDHVLLDQICNPR